MIFFCWASRKKGSFQLFFNLNYCLMLRVKIEQMRECGEPSMCHFHESSVQIGSTREQNTSVVSLMCTSIKCSAKVTMNVKLDITIIKCRSVHKFTNNIPDSTMLNMEHYGEIFHNHRNCQEIRNDGTWKLNTIKYWIKYKIRIVVFCFLGNCT